MNSTFVRLILIFFIYFFDFYNYWNIVVDNYFSDFFLLVRWGFLDFMYADLPSFIPSSFSSSLSPDVNMDLQSAVGNAG